MSSIGVGSPWHRISRCFCIRSILGGQLRFRMHLLEPRPQTKIKACPSNAGNTYRVRYIKLRESYGWRASRMHALQLQLQSPFFLLGEPPRHRIGWTSSLGPPSTPLLERAKTHTTRKDMQQKTHTHAARQGMQKKRPCLRFGHNHGSHEAWSKLKQQIYPRFGHATRTKQASLLSEDA